MLVEDFEFCCKGTFKCSTVEGCDQQIIFETLLVMKM